MILMSSIIHQCCYVFLFKCQPSDPGQAQWIYVDTMVRQQWDDWESLRIIQVVQHALIQVVPAVQLSESGVPAVQQGLPDNTPQPPSATLGPRQLLAQAWRLVDMRTWRFELPSCTTGVKKSCP